MFLPEITREHVLIGIRSPFTCCSLLLLNPSRCCDHLSKIETPVSCFLQQVWVAQEQAGLCSKLIGLLMSTCLQHIHAFRRVAFEKTQALLKPVVETLNIVSPKTLKNCRLHDAPEKATHHHSRHPRHCSSQQQLVDSEPEGAAH